MKMKDLNLEVEDVEDVFDESAPTFFKKRTATQKRMIKNQRKKAHRGTNWKTVKSKKGYKRVKIGKNKYVRVKMSLNERRNKKRTGKFLGKNKRLRK